MQGIDEVFLPWIIKALKPERGVKCNNDFHYLHSFTVANSPKDYLTYKPFTFSFITEVPAGEKKKVKHCCSDSDISFVCFFVFLLFLPIEEIIQTSFLPLIIIIFLLIP